MLTQVIVSVYRQFNRIVPVPGDLKSGMPAEVLTPEKRVRYYRQMLHERTSTELLFSPSSIVEISRLPLFDFVY